MRWIARGVAMLFGTLLILFGLLPAVQPSFDVTLIGILIITVCAMYLSMADQRFFSTWRGFGAAALGCLGMLLWLNWQWDLWRSPFWLPQSLNAVASLLAWMLLVAVFMSSVLLLIKRDASVVFIGAAWALVPVILLIVGAHYGQFERFSSAPLAEQTLLGVPLLWAMAMLCLAPIAFLAHGVRLLVKEINAR